MQAKEQATGSGRVQWVNPHQNRSRTNLNQSATKKEPKQTYASEQSVDGTNADHYDDHYVATIDDSVCRTIGLIVGQYLKELKEHQQNINTARFRSSRDASRETDENNFIPYNDVSRLKVRDEQTKAIETIKQLTNYLRELSYLIRQIDQSDEPSSEDIFNKLSDTRNDIIQALNDFALVNSDIDIPILDPDEAQQGRDFDLCADAKTPTKDFNKTELWRESFSESNEHKKFNLLQKQRATSSSNQFSDKNADDDQPQQQRQLLVQIDDNNSRVVELERRRRDIQKLEKDTVELRRLFADFYNLVKTQGEQVDTIESNLVSAVGDVQYNLGRPAKKMSVILTATGFITGAIIGGPIGLIIGGKLGGITVVCTTSLLGMLSSIGIQKCAPGRLKIE